MVPLSFVGSVAVMAVALFIAGFAIAPTLIATTSATQQVVPAARLTEGMSIIHTGITAGVAPGATLAGYIIDHYGASPAFLVALGAGTTAALVAQTLPRQPMVPDEEPETAPV